MVKDPRKQFDLFAPIASIECIIGDEHLHGAGVSQRLQVLSDHLRTQQQKESSPMGMNRIEKAIHRVLSHPAASLCFEGAVQALAAKDQGEQHAENSYRRNPLFLADVAAFQQLADSLF